MAKLTIVEETGYSYKTTSLWKRVLEEVNDLNSREYLDFCRKWNFVDRGNLWIEFSSDAALMEFVMRWS